MSTRPWGGVIRQLRKTVLLHDAASLTDGQLLDCFLARREEAAFEALVRRHGPMVLSVCRRVLHDAHDAEDAFQATFLVLVRKAASVQPRELVGNWLYGVAYRTALEARTILARRRTRERQVIAMPERVAPDADVNQDLRPLLDQELNRLPEKYRAAVVLCDLEGRSRKEVAVALRIPEGTLSSRLATARRLLADRLTRRGLTLSGGAVASALAESAAGAAVPVPLLASTVQAAVLTAGGQALVAGVVSAKVVFLTEGVLKAMFLTKIKSVTAVCMLLVVLGGGVGFVGHATRAGGPESENAGQAKSEKSLKAVPPSTTDARLNMDVDKKLSTVANIKYENTSLSDILEHLRDTRSVNVLVDKPALTDANISLDVPVTLRLQNVSFKIALKHILHDVGLTYTIQEGILIVTTPQANQGRLVRRVYPVADLAPPTLEAGPNGELVPPTLVRVITRTVGPQTWDDAGGHGTIEYFPDGRSLVVNHTSEIQDQIQELITELRAAKKEGENMVPLTGA